MNTRRLRTAWRVLTSEGWRAARDRALDRLAERRRARSYPILPATAPLPFEVPVLNLLAAPPSPLLGGVAIQFLHRLSLEERERPVALLYPSQGGLRVEASRPSEGSIARFSMRWRAGGPFSPAPRDPAFEATVRAAMDRLGTRILHVEGLAGFPHESLLGLSTEGVRLVVSVHDFAAWCVRPHLVEEPSRRFCDYCREEARCRDCLAIGGLPSLPLQHRATAAGLLARAEAVVYPSGFARRQHLGLFPSLDPDRQHVIEPTSPLPSALPPLRAARKRGFHVAYVGAVHPHKGAALLPDVVTALADLPDLRFTVLGGGESTLVERLRRLPRVAMRGYYRAGSLPYLLRSDAVDVALLLSIWPETHGITLDECAAAGVPVVAFDLGAIGARLGGRGVAVPAAEGAQGIARALRRILEQGVDDFLPPSPPRAAVPAALAWRDLYSALGVREQALRPSC